MIELIGCFLETWSSIKNKTQRQNAFESRLVARGQSCRASRGGPQWGCLLGNQTRDFVADFLIAILRPSQLGSATN